MEYYNENDPDSAYTTFSIKAKASLFPSQKVGKQFVYDLINLPKTISTNAIKNFNADIVITNDFNKLTFDDQIDQLADQYKSYLRVFTDLGYTFGTSAIANEDGKQLKELQSEFEQKYKMMSNGSAIFYDELDGTLDSKYYVNLGDESVETTIAKVKALCESDIKSIDNNKTLLAIAEKKLESLNNSQLINTASNSSLVQAILETSNTIENLKLSIFKIDRELNRYGYVDDGFGNYTRDPAETVSALGKLEHIDDNAAWVAECKAFQTEINKYNTELVGEGEDKKDRENVSQIYRYCYTNYQNRVNILNGGYVSLDGHLSNIIGAAAGFVGGFAISSLVTFAIYVFKKEQEEQK